MIDIKKSTLKQELTGKQMLLISVILMAIGFVMNNPFGTLILFVGIIFLLFSFARFSKESKSKLS